MWSSIHGTSVFYTWAGDTFELLSIHHLEQMQDALRIASVDRNYCWSGTAPDGHDAQIDLVMESKASQTDFLCEMKFSMSRFGVKLDDELDFLHKISAFEASKMHKPARSIQLVLVTTFGLIQGEHSGMVHRMVTLEDLFK